MKAVLLAATIALGGCAATVDRASPLGVVHPPINVPSEARGRVVLNVQLDARHPADSGWASFRKEWIDITQEQALKLGLKFEVQEGEPKPLGQPGVLVAVKVNDYRHVSIGQRMMLGIMTGNAFIDASVQFRDLGTGSVLGERSYNTSSSAGHGVFAAVTPKQIYAIADDTMAEVKGTGR